MDPVDIIRDAQAKSLTDKDGRPVALQLLPGLDDGAIAEFESGLPCRLPDPVRDLLRLCRGFEGVGVERVDFTGRDMHFGQEDVFPDGLPVAADGFGNCWIVDLAPGAGRFGPVWFACHDAPVVLYQADDLGGFLVELFKMCGPPHKSLVDDVREDRIRQVWRTNPGVLAYRDCVGSTDTALRDFASALGPAYGIIDLRDAKPGDGFSWGRYGPDTEVRRYGSRPLFAYKQKQGLLARWFGR
jgi:cell wall assembly regulator SMI1